MPTLLDDDELAAALSRMPAWSGNHAAICRTVELASFPAAIEVVDRVAEVAEELDHHPDIDVRWRTLTFSLSTHSAGGVTDADVGLAERIDALVEQSTR